MRKKSFITIVMFLFIVLLGTSWAQDCLQTQMSSDANLEACLLEAKVSRDVLTIKVILENTSDEKITPKFYYEDVYFTDVGEKKKYSPLKDSEENYIAGPKADDQHGGRFWYDIEPGKKKIFWVKFPAPPEDCSSIDVFVPEIMPFEEIPVER